MSATVEKTRAARRDLLDHFVYLGQRSVNAARRFRRATERAFELLATFPEIAPFWDDEDPQFANVRVWPLSGKFDKYLIFYRVEPDVIKILRVRHASQDLQDPLQS